MFFFCQCFEIYFRFGQWKKQLFLSFESFFIKKNEIDLLCKHESYLSKLMSKQHFFFTVNNGKHLESSIGKNGNTMYKFRKVPLKFLKS